MADPLIGHLIEAPEPPAAPPRSPTSRGFGVGMAGVRAAGQGLKALGARVIGAQEIEQQALAAAQAEQEAVAQDVMRVEDVTSFGEALDFGRYALGTAAPSILASILGGVAGRVGGRLLARGAAPAAREFAKDAGTIVGLGATSTGLETGGIFPEAVEQGVESPVTRSLAGGAAAGSLDILPQIYLARRLGVLGEAARAPARGFGARARAGATEALKTAPLEGLTEGGQEAIGRFAAGKDLSSPEALSEYINAAAIGAIAGGTIGGAGGVTNLGTAEPARPAPAPQPAVEPEAPLPAIEGVDQRAADISLLSSIPAGLDQAPLQTPFEAAQQPAPAPGVATPTPFRRGAAPVAQDADALMLEALTVRRADAQSRLDTLSTELKDEGRGRPKADVLRDIKAAQDELTQIGVQDTQIGQAMRNREAIASLPEAAPRTPKAEPAPASDIIQTRAPDPDTAAAEAAVAQVKRNMGMLVSSREAKLVPKVDTGDVSFVIPESRTPRERVKTADAKTRRDTIEGVAVESIKRHAAELAAAGAFRKGTALKAREAVIAAAVEAANAPTVEAAQKQVFDAAIKALGNKVNKTDAETFARLVSDDVAQAPKFYSKAARLEPIGRDGRRESDRVAAILDSNVSEFSAQVLEERDAPELVSAGVRQWAIDNRLNEGQFRRHLYRLWSASAEPRLKSLAASILARLPEQLESRAGSTPRAVSSALAEQGVTLPMVDAFLTQKALGPESPAVQRQGSINVFADLTKDAGKDPAVVADTLDNLIAAGGQQALFNAPESVLPNGMTPVARDAAVDFRDAILTARGRETLEQLRFMIGDDPNLDVRFFNAEPGDPVGSYQRVQPYKDVIELALNAKDIMSLGAHEGFHYLEARKLTGGERSVISRAFAPGKPLYKAVLDRAIAYDRENGTNLADEIRTIPQEARAYGFEFWKRGELQAEGVVARIFQKIREVIERVANFVKGQGFQSTEDIFRAIELGAYAQRPARAGGVAIQRSDAAAVAPFPRVAPGTLVDGRIVRESIPNQASIRASLTDFTILPGVREVPLSAFDPEYIQSVLAARPDARTQRLMDGIRESGELNPLIVAVDTRGPYIIEGGHRLDALIRLGATSLPAQVVIDHAPEQALFSRAATEMDRRIRNGELEREQFDDMMFRLADDARAPAPTLKEVFGATVTQFTGGLRRWRLQHLATGNYTASKSRAYANVQKVLRAFIQKKSYLTTEGARVQLSKWQAASGADMEAAGDALMRRTVGGYVEGSPEFNEVVESLTPEQRGLFDQANAMIADRLEQEFQADRTVMEATLPAADFEEWVANRRDQVDRLKREGYVPERRFGDHVVHIFLPRVDERGRQNNLTVFYEQFESEGEAKILLDRYKRIVAEKSPELQVEYGFKHKVERDTTMSMQQFLDTARRNGIPLTQVARENIAKALVAADSTKRNRLFRRKNIAGFSQDAQRVLHEFVVTTSNKIAYTEFSSAINDAAVGRAVDARVESGVTSLTTDQSTNLWKDDGPEANFYRNLSDELVDYVLVPDQRGEWSTKLRGAAMMYFLGGSFASGVVNMMSVPMNTLPWLSQYTDYSDAFTKTTAAWSTTMKNAAVLRDVVKLKDKVGTPIPDIDAVPGLRAALIAAAEDGTTQDTEIHQIMGLSQGGLLARSRKVQKAIEVWMWPFRFAEQTNRIATFSAAWQVGLKNNLQGRDLYDFAKNTVDNTQNRYDEANRPGAARDPIYAMLFMFKSFPLFTIEMVETMYRQNPKSAVYMLMGLVALSGVNGLPFAEPIMDLVDTISQRLFGSPFNTRRAMRNILKDASEAVVGVDLSDLALRGTINQMTGFNVASRIGLGDFVPGTRIGAADNDYGRLMEQVLGAPFAMVGDVATGASALSKGEFVKAFREGGPLAARNVIKATEQLDRGYAIDSKGRKLVDVSGPQAFWQSLGFSSAALARAYDLDRIDKQTEAFYSQVQEDMMGKLTKAIREGDQAGAQEVMDAAAKWSQAYPQQPIIFRGSTIRRRIIESGMTLNERTLRNLPRQLRASSVAAEELE